MRRLLLMLRLAAADWCRERLITSCSVLGLAAVLAPLLILYGVNFGVVHTMTERMLSDPTMLELSPIASGRFSVASIADFAAAQPSVAFAIPRTRSIAAVIKLAAHPVPGADRRTDLVSIEPSGPTDPLLLRGDCSLPDGLQHEATHPSSSFFFVVLSASAAERLGVAKGAEIEGIVERSDRGIIQRATVALHVAGVLPLALQQKDTAYVPLALADAVETFRDGREVPALGKENGWTGEPVPAGERMYAGFRLYAKHLEDVAHLRDILKGQGIETYTKAEEIEQLTSLSNSLTLIFSLICVAACIGFLASTLSGALASVRRKARSLGILRLMGFTAPVLILFPLTQALLNAVSGSVIAIALYQIAATIINRIFAGSLQGLESVCLLLPTHYLLAFAGTCLLSLLAALGPSIKGACTEPSEVIR